MTVRRAHWMWLGSVIPVIAACGLTDGATRIAYAIEAGVAGLAATEGSRHTIDSISPTRGSECAGPYNVQFDKVGALIIWCKDAAGAVTSSHSTSYHARFIDTPKTWLLDKAAGETLAIEIERKAGRASVVEIR
jgi:hypothetical protein